MSKVYIEINHCKECPHLEKKNQYSSDGFDQMEDWVCGKLNKTIQHAVEWHEVKRIEIPDWCLLRRD